MKVLVIAQTFPYPLNTGSRNTIFHWVEAINRAHAVEILFLGEPAEARQPIPELPGVKVETIALNVGFALSVRILRLLRAMVFGIPPTSLVGMKSNISQAVVRYVQEGGFDVVLLSENAVAGFAGNLSKFAPVVLLKHSVHAVDAKDARRRGGTWHPRWLLEEWMVKRFEARSCRAATVVCTVNAEDAADLARRYHLEKLAEIVSIGVDFSKFPFRENDPGGEALAFFGNMNWGANLDAVGWFAGRVLPKVWRKFPKAEFRIMGPGSDRVLLNNDDPRISRYGECDIAAAMKEVTVGVVPVVSGTGVRFKLLEMLRMGIPLVTTSLGALGSGMIDGEHALVADDEDSFADAIMQLFSKPELRRRLICAGAELSAGHAWDKFYPRILNVIELAANSRILPNTGRHAQIARIDT